MSSHQSPPREADQPRVYQIRVRGHISPQWTDWFEGLTITLEEEGSTLLTGPVIDQAGLYGLLKKVRDSGMPLLSVNSVGLHPQDTPEVNRGWDGSSDPS